jgi:hypothetical protein
VLSAGVVAAVLAVLGAGGAGSEAWDSGSTRPVALSGFIAFVSGRAGVASVYAMDRYGRRERALTRGPAAATWIDAKLADGVLTVRVPRSEKAERRKIEIKAK